MLDSAKGSCRQTSLIIAMVNIVYRGEEMATPSSADFLESRGASLESPGCNVPKGEKLCGHLRSPGGRIWRWLAWLRQVVPARKRHQNPGNDLLLVGKAERAGNWRRGRMKERPLTAPAGHSGSC